MQKINDELAKKLLQEYEEADGQTPLPAGYREEMLQAIVSVTEGTAIADGGIMTGDPVIEEEKSIAERPARLRAIWKWAAAACILLAFTGWYLLHPGQEHKKSPALAQAPSWIGRHNADHKKIGLQLPDQSTVQLSPGATIRYRKDYGSYEKREVKVEGEAVFEVVKNTQMPFIVYSEGISTTVLGTIFQVTDSLNGSSIRIKLLEGKVMVGLGALANKDAPANYYLSPGQELLFDKGSRDVAIRDAGRHSGAYASNRVKYVPAKMDSLTSWYMFNNQGLAEVFDQLSAIYNVEIQYSREDLNKKYFIGRLEKKDSLSKIIRDIALLNHLSVTLQNGRYIIGKQRKP
ncbi:MAG TPA: FecR domain-containing protein [Puia sp.]|nr:FecR domain-containing protein [Puia sp.]